MIDHGGGQRPESARHDHPFNSNHRCFDGDVSLGAAIGFASVVSVSSWHLAPIGNLPDVCFAPEAAVCADGPLRLSRGEPLAQGAAFTLQLSLSGLTSSVGT